MMSSDRALGPAWLSGLLAILQWRRRPMTALPFSGTRWRGLLPY